MPTCGPCRSRRAGPPGPPLLLLTRRTPVCKARGFTQPLVTKEKLIWESFLVPFYSEIFVSELFCF